MFLMTRQEEHIVSHSLKRALTFGTSLGKSHWTLDIHSLWEHLQKGHIELQTYTHFGNISVGNIPILSSYITIPLICKEYPRSGTFSFHSFARSIPVHSLWEYSVWSLWKHPHFIHLQRACPQWDIPKFPPSDFVLLCFLVWLEGESCDALGIAPVRVASLRPITLVRVISLQPCLDRRY